MRPATFIIPTLCAISLSGCASDKTMHFVAGVAASKYVTKQTNSPLQGCAAALASGIAKEIYDSRFGGVVDRYDALATGAGCMYTIRF
ncbi:MAG: hypothetical protein WBC85_04170 [Planktotalea sp.]|uniref:hypothetical protein n=1 Tax=Planktotalea sp. TaxID=2029877 RepID=UPI003C75CCEE